MGLRAALHTCVYKVNIMYELIEYSRSQRERERERELWQSNNSDKDRDRYHFINQRQVGYKEERECIHMSQGSKC